MNHEESTNILSLNGNKSLNMGESNAHQRLAVAQGDLFHQECIRSLQIAGFEVADQHVRIAEIGVEIDAITNNANGIAMPWEFKGSWNGSRPGLRRTDTLKKAICNGYLLTQWSQADRLTPLLVMTTHLPEDGSGLAMMHAVGRNVVMAFVDSRDTKLLTWLYKASEETLIGYISQQVMNFN